ncbi:hypothetical protein FKM82_028626, partial [Ascaphus truei]
HTGVPSPSNGGAEEPESPPRLPPAFCPPQERGMNLGFTLGSFLLGVSFLPLQVIMDFLRPRSLRQVGSALVSVSCLMVAYSSSNPHSLSLFLPFALVALGIGGSCIMFTSLM